MHSDKDRIETFVEDIVNEVKWYDEVWNISTTAIGTAVWGNKKRSQSNRKMSYLF